MINILNKYIGFLRENHLTAFNHPGLTEDALTHLSARQKIMFPPLLKQLYEKIGGQDAEILSRCPYRLLPPAEIPLVQQRLLEHICKIYGNDWQSYQITPFDDAGKVKNILYHPARIPVIQNDNDDYYCLDYAPDTDGHPGQILAVIGNPTLADEPLFLMFDDIEECLQDILADLQDENPQNLEDFFSESREAFESYDNDTAVSVLTPRRPDAAAAHRYDNEIRRHIETHVGEIHEIYQSDDDTEDLKIELYHVLPQPNRPFHTFITGGMSHQTLPADDTPASENQRLELLVFLPSDWPVGKKAFADENHYWPIHFLQLLAHLPQQQKTGLYLHQMIPVSGKDNDIADTDFTGFLLIPPIHLAPEFARLDTHDGEKILFLAVMPLYPEEMAFVLTHGINALIQKFNKHKINAVINPHRANSAENP